MGTEMVYTSLITSMFYLTQSKCQKPSLLFPMKFLLQASSRFPAPLQWCPSRLRWISCVLYRCKRYSRVNEYINFYKYNLYLPFDGSNPPLIEIWYHEPYFGTSIDPFGVINRIPDHVQPIVATVGMKQELVISRKISGKRNATEWRREPIKTRRESLEIPIIISSLYISYRVV